MRLSHPEGARPAMETITMFRIEDLDNGGKRITCDLSPQFVQKLEAMCHACGEDLTEAWQDLTRDCFQAIEDHFATAQGFQGRFVFMDRNYGYSCARNLSRLEPDQPLIVPIAKDGHCEFVDGKLLAGRGARESNTPSGNEST